jgi:hypothetical protein
MQTQALCQHSTRWSVSGFMQLELSIWCMMQRFCSCLTCSCTKHGVPARFLLLRHRLHNLVGVSGLMDQLHMLKPRPATIAELSR